MPSRRDLLKTTAVAAATCILPKNIFATPASNFHFIDTDTQTFWPILNPVTWSLQNAHEPILERAADGLKKLTPDDGDRIIRLVTRRCSLNLLEVHERKVHVHYWGTKGQADLKPFFKQHGLARQDIAVELQDRKKEVVTTLKGDSFLFGVPIASDFPLELYHEKWTSRLTKESDDTHAAPQTASGFAWNGIEDGRIPWAALKSAWRRGGSGVCLNCSVPMLLVNFGLRQVGMFNRIGFIEYACRRCDRTIQDSVEDVPGWMAVNLDLGVLPEYEMVWGKRLKLEARS